MWQPSNTNQEILNELRSFISETRLEKLTKAKAMNETIALGVSVLASTIKTYQFSFDHKFSINAVYISSSNTDDSIQLRFFFGRAGRNFLFKQVEEASSLGTMIDQTFYSKQIPLSFDIGKEIDSNEIIRIEVQNTHATVAYYVHVVLTTTIKPRPLYANKAKEE